LPAIPAQEASDYLSNLTEEGEFSDISPFGPRKISTEPLVTTEIERLGAITAAVATQKISLDSPDAKIRLFSGIELTGEKLRMLKLQVEARESGKIRSATEPSLSRAEQRELRDQLGKVAVQLADQVQAGLASPDAAIARAAKQARDSIVASANFSDLLWKGYGVNSRVVRQQDQNSAEVRSSVIYEAGEIWLSEKVAIDVGRPAFIEMTETPLNRGFSAGRLAASTGASAGPVSNVGSEADTYVLNTAPDFSSGGTSGEVYVGHGAGYKIDGLYRFDISEFSQYTSSATVELTPNFWYGAPA